MLVEVDVMETGERKEGEGIGKEEDIGAAEKEGEMIRGKEEEEMIRGKER